MKTLNVEHLQVETFVTSNGDPGENYTLLAGSCGCGTLIDCPSQAIDCTTPCIAPSGATEAIRCCG